MHVFVGLKRTEDALNELNFKILKNISTIIA